METIEVTAHFDIHGNITPSHFLYKGTKHAVEKIGRRWETDTGQYFLVMVPVDKIYKLKFNKQESRWYLDLLGANLGTS